jgi:Vacuolar protein sorting-associated protein 62
MSLGDGHEPIFSFHAGEEFHPLAVESAERTGSGILMPNGKRAKGIDLDALPEDGMRMILQTMPLAAEKELQAGELARVGYRRTKKGGGLTWVQYWLWYLYNPKRFVVTGEHEGDWEFVQVGYAGETPICMTASQHKAGGARMWWELEHREGRPVVYVAHGSHANYFEPVKMQTAFDDEADGRGLELDSVTWRRFGPWASWSGRWGNSSGAGDSPESPGCQGARWQAPHAYHTSAKHQVP